MWWVYEHFSLCSLARCISLNSRRAICICYTLDTHIHMHVEMNVCNTSECNQLITVLYICIRIFHEFCVVFRSWRRKNRINIRASFHEKFIRILVVGTGPKRSKQYNLRLRGRQRMQLRAKVLHFSSWISYIIRIWLENISTVLGGKRRRKKHVRLLNNIFFYQ